ncbi:hypothetical protein [Candidatus Hodgkinia cicadicola]|uniref:hypothetical protein n=1 Tax=Candidatus Hodgkinia cicadicola TaxID=573658 RepID=UPI0011BA8FCB
MEGLSIGGCLVCCCFINDYEKMDFVVIRVRSLCLMFDLIFLNTDEISVDSYRSLVSVMLVFI